MEARGYAALWTAGGEPLAGRITLGRGALRLDGGSHGRDVSRRIGYGRIASLALGRGEEERIGGRPAVVLTLADGETIRVATSELGALHELVELLAAKREATMKRIVIGADGSADASCAVEKGLELALALGASVTFVCARTAPSSLLGEPYYQRELDEETVHARRVAEDAAARAVELGVTASFQILDGPAADAILTVAETHDADLIVVGSRGHGAVQRVLFGSVSKAVVTRSPRPVLIVKDQSRQQPQRDPALVDHRTVLS